MILRLLFRLNKLYVGDWAKETSKASKIDSHYSKYRIFSKCGIGCQDQFLRGTKYPISGPIFNSIFIRKWGK